MTVFFDVLAVLGGIALALFAAFLIWLVWVLIENMLDNPDAHDQELGE